MDSKLEHNPWILKLHVSQEGVAALVMVIPGVVLATSRFMAGGMRGGQR